MINLEFPALFWAWYAIEITAQLPWTSPEGSGEVYRVFPGAGYSKTNKGLSTVDIP